MVKKLFQISEQSSSISAKMQEISKLLLTTPNCSPYAFHAFAKSEAECGNSKQHQANSSTPLTRAFFVRSSRTPKERYILACSSMVACSGQGFALDCTPDVAVFHPVARYRPTLWKMLAIAPINLHQELSAMLYKFMLLGKNRLKIAIRATSIEHARQQLNLAKNQAVFIAQINTRGRYV